MNPWQVQALATLVVQFAVAIFVWGCCVMAFEGDPNTAINLISCLIMALIVLDQAHGLRG